MPSPIRFYLDEHIHRAVATRLRQRGVDVVRTQEVGLRGAADEAHLDFARREKRVLVTGDSDFLRLDSQGFPHFGIVYLQNVQDVGQVIESLALISEVMDADEMIDHIEYW